MNGGSGNGDRGLDGPGGGDGDPTLECTGCGHGNR